jgi:PAS domain S-box-containing protein
MDELKVLIVDNSVDDADRMTRQLSLAGLSVRSVRVETEVEFRDAMETRPWDLIISDFHLRSFSGLNALEVFQAYGIDIPFIMISGMVGEDVAVDAMRRGVSDYLVKGNLARLGPVVERELRDSAHRRERRLAENALKESEERYRIVAETASDAIVTITYDSSILYVNSAAQRIFGYSRAEMVGNNITMLMPEALKPQHLAAIDGYVKTGRRGMNWSGSVLPAIKKDGTEILVSISFGEFLSKSQHAFTAIIRDITETKRAEAALRQSEADFRALIQATTQFVWTAEAKGSSAELFAWFSEMYERPVNSVEEILALMHPDDAASIEEEWKTALQNRTLFDRVCRFLKTDGTIVYLAVRSIPIFDEDESFRHWIGTFTDITERMVAEVTLGASETQLRTIVESVPECVKLLDTEGRLLKINRAGIEMLEADSFELIRGQLFANVVTPEFRNAFIECTKNVASGNASELQFEILSLKGNRRWMDLKAVPIRDSSGKIVSVLCVTRDETERRKADEALRMSEERFRDLFENANDLIYTHDLEGNFTSLNRAGERITGYSRNEAIRINVKDVVAPEYQQLATDRIRVKIGGGGDATSYETAIITKDGRRVMLDLSTRLISQNGKPSAIQGIARDITERRRAELAIRSNELQLRVITNTIPVSIAYLGADQIFRFANRAFLEWLGKTASEVIGSNVRDILGDESYRQINPEFERVLNGELFDVERYAFKSPASIAGNRLPFVRMNYVPEFAPSGEVVAFFAFMTDITESKNAEVALRKSAKQLEMITNTVPAAIIYVDKDQVCRFANDSYLDWVGKSENEVLGRHLRDFMSEAAYEKALPEAERVLNGEEFTLERPAYFISPERGSTDLFHVRVSYVPDYDIDGQIAGFFFFSIDLTETKRAEEALRNSEEQLLQSQKLESVGRLAGGIAHDFNNMLTAINGYSELTLRRMHPSDPLRNNIEEIKKAGERSAELTNQLLAFSRRQIMQPRLLELNRAVSDLVPMLERLIGKDVQLRTSFSREKGVINADPGQLSQVLLNLVVNAKDSLPDGGSISIETFLKQIDQDNADTESSVKPGLYSVLAISDTGVGMDEHTIQHIFEPFFTTKEVGKGTGLGLSTVYGIVHQSGGSVTVSSAPGKGTRFEIYLPVAESDERSSSVNKLARGNLSFGTETILLVEDEETVRDLSREVLVSCGYTVVTAKDGVSALAVLEEKGDRISLVLTDVIMPNMGGRELAEETKKRFPEVKILFSSGYDDNSIVNDGVLREETNFIQKPFTFDSLALKVRELLDQK